MSPPVDITIIIVNYNVKYFLEQCLRSISESKHPLNIETIVVDNNSVDGSVNLVKAKFPDVFCIANKKNIGFGRANNQAMEMAKGTYQLILNPDTVLEQNTLSLCHSFMEKTNDAGALGVRMIDGKGKFLPESKRGLPTPAVALYKILLLNKIFPKSKTFGRYHAGYLAENEVNEVDVLSGAFMFIRSSVLKNIGFFDEQYFMYGEDIDLSYRITKAGYKNYYFPQTTIIHYKGESTKKKTINYVRTFYSAMIIFSKTHYSGGYQKWMVNFLKLAIWGRASVAILQRGIEKIWAPLIDFAILYLGFYFLGRYWEVYNIFVPQNYPSSYFLLHLPAYIYIILGIVKLSGGYSFPYKLYRAQRGVLIGAIVLIALYGLLPKSIQFSRAIVLLGSMWCLIGITLSRYLINYIKTNSWEFNADESQKIAILSSKSEYHRVVSMFEKVGKKGKVIGNISPMDHHDSDALGNVNQLKDIIDIYRINELIFCGANLSSKEIIHWMSELAYTDIKYKIVPAGGDFIVGSHSKNAQGELFSIDFELQISSSENQLKKRLLDVLFGIFLFLCIPIAVFKPKKIIKKISQAVSLILGSKTLVSYLPHIQNQALPALKQGFLYPASKVNKNTDSGTIERVNFLYAKDYSPNIDFELFLKNLKYLAL